MKSRVVTFDVRYYDDFQERILDESPLGDRIRRIVKDDLKVPLDEFLVYTLFKEQCNTHPDFTTFDKLRRKLPDRLAHLEDYLDFSNGTVHSKRIGINEIDDSAIERAGIGAALAVISQALDLTEADWEKLPVGRNKSLDFQITSADGHYVEVEAKGTVTNEVVKKAPLSSKKVHILAKKSERRLRTTDRQGTLIGVIAAFPHDRRLTPTISLLDPLSIPPPKDPDHYRLLERMLFYLRNLSPLTSSRFLVALTDRIQTLAHSTELQELDGLPLTDTSGEPLAIPPFNGKTQFVLGDTKVFGEAFAHKGQLYFAGFDTSVLGPLLSQNHLHILAYSSKIRDLIGRSSRFTALLRDRDMRESGIDLRRTQEMTAIRRWAVDVEAELHASTAGRVFGRLHPI